MADDKEENVWTFAAALGALKNPPADFKEELKTVVFDMDSCDENGKTLLMHIADVQNNASDSAWILLEYMADPNIKDKEGNTALHYAFKNTNKPLILLYLMFGANPDITNDLSQKAFQVVPNKNDDMERLFQKINDYKYDFLQLGKKARKRLRNVFKNNK